MDEASHQRARGIDTSYQLRNNLSQREKKEKKKKRLNVQVKKKKEKKEGGLQKRAQFYL